MGVELQDRDSCWVDGDDDDGDDVLKHTAKTATAHTHNLHRRIPDNPVTLG